MASTADKRQAFRKLHESGCFVIPNPWNPGSARYLEGLGFKALASTSSGYAHSQGFADGALTRDQVLAHFREIAASDPDSGQCRFRERLRPQAGRGRRQREAVHRHRRRRPVDRGFHQRRADPIYDFDLAVARVKAARAAIDQAGGDVLLTGRAEGFLHGRPDLDDAIKRLKAFSDAGADCLYAPGIKTREQIVAVVKAVAPKPVNLLNHTTLGFTVQDIADMGVRRISVGGTLARVAMHAFIKSATRNRQGRQVRQLRRHHLQRRTQQILRAPSPRELGAASGDRPAGRPAGRHDAGQAARAGRAAGPLWPRGETRARATPPALWKVFAGHPEVWTYISTDGPFADETTFTRLHRQARGRARSLRLRHHRSTGTAPSAISR